MPALHQFDNSVNIHILDHLKIFVYHNEDEVNVLRYYQNLQKLNPQKIIYLYTYNNHYRVKDTIL